MNRKHESDVDERLAGLERAVGALKDSLAQLSEMMGGPGAGGMGGGFAAGAMVNPVSLAGSAFGFPFFLFGFRRLPFSYPTQRIAGSCNSANATIPVPDQGNYVLTINVAHDSDCSVLVTDPQGIAQFGPVSPGDSLATLFRSFSATLIARCRGRGEKCMAEITLTQVS